MLNLLNVELLYGQIVWPLGKSTHVMKTEAEKVFFWDGHDGGFEMGTYAPAFCSFVWEIPLEVVLAMDYDNFCAKVAATKGDLDAAESGLTKYPWAGFGFGQSKKNSDALNVWANYEPTLPALKTTFVDGKLHVSYANGS